MSLPYKNQAAAREEALHTARHTLVSLCKTHIQRPVVYSLLVSVYTAAVCVNGRLSSPCHTPVYCCGKMYELVEMQQCSFVLSYVFKTELLMRRLRQCPHLLILPV